MASNVDSFDYGIIDYLSRSIQPSCDISLPLVSKERLNEINSLIRYDAIYAYKAFALWRAHPELRKICCFSYNNDYVTFIRKMATFGNDFFSDLNTFVRSKFREEVERVCPRMKTEPFCNIYYALTIIDLTNELPYKRSDWTKDDIEKSEVILIHVVVLIREYPSVYGSLRSLVPPDREKTILMNAVNRIVQYIQGGEVIKLRTIHMQLPRMHAFTQTDTSCNSDKLCILMKIITQLDGYVEQLDLFENSSTINGRRRVILNSGTDYTEFLKQKQLNRILQVLDQQSVSSLSIATALKGHVTDKFSELKSYYQQVESFNGEIAKADLGYITGRLAMFRERITTVVGNFKKKMTTLIQEMMIGAAVEVAAAAVTLAAAVADACNPLGFLFGGADPVDLAEAIADVARAAALIAEGSAVSIKWGKVSEQATKINNKFKKNQDFLTKVKQLVYEETKTRTEFEHAKNTFLEQYNAYDPQVLPDDLVAMNALWSGLADAACGVVDGFETAAGVAARGVVKAQNLCLDLPVLAE